MQFVNNYKHLQPHICLFILLAACLLSLNIIPPTTLPASASSDVAKWVDIDIPAAGPAGNWALAEGSDIHCLAAASDGTLYAGCTGLTYSLYKSTDGGTGWSPVGEVTDHIVAIALSPVSATTVYYATPAEVFRSSDGGNTFQLLPPGPGGAGHNNIEITSLDVTAMTGDIIAVGTRDKDSLEYGGVYILEEAGMSFTWTDSEIGGYDVYSVAFSLHSRATGSWPP